MDDLFGISSECILYITHYKDTGWSFESETKLYLNEWKHDQILTKKQYQHKTLTWEYFLLFYLFIYEGLFMLFFMYLFI